MTEVEKQDEGEEFNISNTIDWKVLLRGTSECMVMRRQEGNTTCEVQSTRPGGFHGKFNRCSGIIDK
jgi:hypothetical protein